MTVKANVPAIRFKGFNGEWEEKKLNQIASNISDGDWIEAEHVFESGLYRIVQTGNIGLGEWLDKANNAKYFHQKDFDELKANEIFPGDILISRLAEPAGRTTILPNIGFRMVTAVDVTIVRPQSNNFDSVFFVTSMNKPQTLKKVNESVSGTSHKRISRKNLEDITLAIPSLEEQSKIGALFSQLDTLITQRQSKYDKLLTLKKALLEKMFPKKGKTVPEIRFKGFSGAWEEKKLSELADIVRGASPRPIQDPKWFDKNSSIGWLRIADVSEQNGRIYSLSQRISKLAEDKTRILLEPHILLSIAASVGKPVINYVSTGVHDGFLIFKNPMFDKEYMFQWMKMFECEWGKYGQPGSQVNLNSEIVKSHIVYIPLDKEQVKIGTLFSQLDTLISLQQKELDKLKILKKALLNKVFV